MKQHNFISILFFLFFLNNAYSQLKTDPSPEEIQKAKNFQKQFSKNKDVDAVVTSKTASYEFYVNKKTNKLNIKEKSEENLISIKNRVELIKYVDYDNNSEVKKFRIYNKRDKRVYANVNDEYLKLKGLFYHDNRVKYTVLGFPLLGYKYKFRYEKIYNDPKYFTSVYFSENQPVIKSTFRFIIPKNVDVVLKELNFNSFDIKKTKKFDAKKNANIIEYTIKNLPARYKEEHMQGGSYIYPHILVLPHAYKDKKQQNHTVFKQTADLYKWYHSLIKQMKENPGVIKPKVKELTAGTKGDIDKIKKIFYWVQDNIRYIAFEDGLAGYKPDESQNVFNKRYGDCKGMANLLTEMLKQSGFDARRTWLGTRHIAYDYSTPNLAVDNHMICTLFYKGKTYYLDATESYVPFGEYAERIQNREVMIENGSDFMLKKVPQHKAAHNQKTLDRTIKINGEQLTGKVSRTFKGQSRTGFLQAYNSIKTEHKKDALKYYIKGDDGNLKLENIKTSDLTNREKDVSFSYDYTLDNAASSFDDEMYLDIDYIKPFGYLDFKKRKTPYQFYHKIDNVYNTVIELPESYKVSEMPQDLHVANEDFTVDITFKVVGNKLIYKKHFLFPKALIQKKNLSEWQKFYEKLNNLYQTQLTLIKK